MQAAAAQAVMVSAVRRGAAPVRGVKALRFSGLLMVICRARHAFDQQLSKRGCGWMRVNAALEDRRRARAPPTLAMPSPSAFS